ncbi:hypothetical protein Taro_000131 [Colocasia esculenta]|uniref:Uncharacterized protein n=1 Tax=Colocasia esculenta TaxID=4460 RepID=A0A843TEA7_COLES|nr:hypothetical protein [Colocasia esculenta]
MKLTKGRLMHTVTSHIFRILMWLVCRVCVCVSGVYWADVFGLQYPRLLSLSSRQEASACAPCVAPRAADVRLATLSALLVGSTDTSCRHWSPTSPFPVPHSSEPRPGSLEVPGMGLRPCGLQCVVSLARLRPIRGRRTRVKHVTGLTGMDEAFHHSWYPSKAVVMDDRRDWGGGGDDPEASTQRMIERIWESLTDIRMRMDQQAPVPPVIREAIPVAPVPPLPGMEVVDAYRGYLSSWVPKWSGSWTFRPWLRD